MGRVVKKIVLTGGPSSDKSSSLELIQKHLTSLGYVVLIVNESATELINTGIKPFGENKLRMVDFQDVILRYQLFKENLFEEIANNYIDKDIVIIYDRGVMDNKAYISDYEFSCLLNKYNLTEQELLNRYDLVIHLETGGKSKYYITENNKARYENIEEAIELDNRTYNAWIHHDNLYKIKCYEKFVDKQNEIIRICDELLNKKEVKELKLVY